MTPSSQQDWSFAAARLPAQFAAALYPPTPDLEHASDRGGTLCGIAEDQIQVYRHLFAPENDSACPTCRRQATAAPTRPSGQELLYNRVLTAAAGPIRDELLDALSRGAEIKLWINGPATTLAKHYARLDQAVEGDPAVIAALGVDASAGLARVEHGPSQFIIVLPEHQPPLVARLADGPAG